MLRNIREFLNPKILITAALIFSFYQVAFTTLSLFKVISLKYYDIIIRLNYNLKKPPLEVKDIVIIKMDDASIKAIHKKFPWPRSLLAELLKKINPHHPKVLVLDLFVFGESDNPQDDLSLAQELAKSKNALLSSYFDEQGIQALPSKDFMEKTAGYGFVNRPRDPDLYIRTARLFKVANNRAIDYSLSLKAAALYLDSSLAQIKFNEKTIVLPSKNKGLIAIPLIEDGVTPVNILADLNRFQTIPFCEALAQDLPSDYFKDKVVLIGATAEIVHDIYSTSLGLMPGVSLIANDILMIITKNFIRVLPYWLNIAILLLICWLASSLTYKFSIFKGMLFSVTLMVVLVLASIILVFKNITTDFFGPIFLVGLTSLVGSSYKYTSLIIEAARLKKMAITDGLTGLYVYRYFEVKLNSEIKTALSTVTNMCLVFFDIDDFKNLNDTYGHDLGNEVLKSVSSILLKNSRCTDTIVRFGGDEFAAILPNTNLEGAQKYAETIRKAIEDFALPWQDKTLKVTVSVGIASLFNLEQITTEKFIKSTDMALYKAKALGRNCVVCSKH